MAGYKLDKSGKIVAAKVVKLEGLPKGKISKKSKKKIMILN